METDDGKKGEQRIKMFLEGVEKKARETGAQIEIKEK